MRAECSAEALFRKFASEKIAVRATVDSVVGHYYLRADKVQLLPQARLYDFERVRKELGWLVHRAARNRPPTEHAEMFRTFVGINLGHRIDAEIRAAGDALEWKGSRSDVPSRWGGADPFARILLTNGGEQVCFDTAFPEHTFLELHASRAWSDIRGPEWVCRAVMTTLWRTLVNPHISRTLDIG